jgi:hypothetical protein
MNSECLNFTDNFIELTVACLPPGRPWDGGLSGYYRCGAGMHTQWKMANLKHGGGVVSGQQAGASQKPDLKGLL